MAHGELRETLGLSRATISKAIRRLVELGLVVSYKACGDGRAKVVALTEEGIRRIRQAFHVVFVGRRLFRHYRAFVRPLVGRKKRGLANRINEALDRVWQSSIELAQHLGNTARVVYDIEYEADH